MVKLGCEPSRDNCYWECLGRGRMRPGDCLLMLRNLVYFVRVVGRRELVMFRRENGIGWLEVLCLSLNLLT